MKIFSFKASKAKWTKENLELEIVYLAEKCNKCNKS